jgi:hypothetical protein
MVLQARIGGITNAAASGSSSLAITCIAIQLSEQGRCEPKKWLITVLGRHKAAIGNVDAYYPPLSLV